MSAAHDSLKLTGKLKIFINDKLVKETENLVTTVGKTWIADRMQGGATTAMTHMAIGTGSTAAVVADTTLDTESFRQALTTSGGVASTNTLTFASTYAAGDGTGTITEAGVFEAASAGEMLARTVFTGVVKAAGDTMTISWVITVS
jgi:hypothetical protein